MSYTVSAYVQNSTSFTLNYQSDSIPWGQCVVSTNVIEPGQTVLAFTGTSNAVFSGCEGTVIYTFTDQNQQSQTVQFYYNDPFSGSNSVSITVPNGMVGNSSIPQHGSDLTANYALAGQPSVEPKDKSAGHPKKDGHEVAYR
jgi:hypothetical protein